MILVVGATGTLGTRLVARLRGEGRALRLLTREPTRAATLAGPGVDVVRGDVRDVASVRRAAEGVTIVVAAAHGFAGTGGSTVDSVDGSGNRHLVDAAAAGGAAVVLMSVVGAAPDSPLPLFRAKAAAERYLWESGVPATVVRATAFVETWTTILADPMRAGGRPLVFGRGRNPINFVSADAVAALLARAVVDPALRGQTLEIGGPTDVTLEAFAALLARRVGGADGPARHVPRPLLRAMGLLLRPFNASLAAQAAAAVVMDTRDMTFDASAMRTRFPELVNPAVRDILAAYVPAR